MARFGRGPVISALLRKLGIDPGRYWLLMDLFATLTDRHEMMSQLGRSGVTLKIVAWMYGGLVTFLGVIFALAQMPLGVYFWTFQGVTAFVLLMVLLSETGNSLVNPVEGLVLAHQPVDGATYTAAKLSHLARILLYLVPALSAGPALAGLALRGSDWLYPLRHLLAGFAVGLTAALLCCAAFGWLLRIVPAPRLKMVGQYAEMLPFLFILLPQFARVLEHVPLRQWLPPGEAARWSLGLGCGAILVGAGAFGIRSLSQDYLIRVTSIVHARPGRQRAQHRSVLGEVAARFFGGQPARAGFEFVRRMVVRDWQFRRQMIPLLPSSVIVIGLVVQGIRTDPFTGRFTGLHVLPHMFGVFAFFVCAFLAFGSYHKAVWLFLVVPARVLSRFSRGVYALLWIAVVVLPHAILIAALLWFWTVAHVALFAAYSLALASVYLALSFRLVEGVPFGKQVDTTRGAYLMPVMMAGCLAMAIVVGLQWLVVFRSVPVVVITTIVAGVAAYLATRSSLGVFERSMRYQLEQLSAESGTLYTEVGA
jgi:hypothetical protein